MRCAKVSEPVLHTRTFLSSAGKLDHALLIITVALHALTADRAQGCVCGRLKRHPDWARTGSGMKSAVRNMPPKLKDAVVQNLVLHGSPTMRILAGPAYTTCSCSMGSVLHGWGLASLTKCPVRGPGGTVAQGEESQRYTHLLLM